MKPPKNKIYGTIVVILFMALMSFGTTGAALLDFLKSPSDLIMNQKNCTFMKNMTGEVVNGNFIVSGANVAVMSIEKVDDNRALARLGREPPSVLLLDVKKSKGTVTATHTPGALLVLECTL